MHLLDTELRLNYIYVYPSNLCENVRHCAKTAQPLWFAMFHNVPGAGKPVRICGNM